MEKLYIKITGITCEHCRHKIKQALEKKETIARVSISGFIAQVEYSGKLERQKLVEDIQALGYETNLTNMSHLKKKLEHSTFVSIIHFLLFGIIFFLLYYFFGNQITGIIPVIDRETTLVMLFVMGIFTSVHCVSMCGAINLLASTSKTKKIKKPLLYNLGRLVSYTILGGLVGLLGSIFQLSKQLQGILLVLSALCLLLMGLSRLGFFSFSILKNHKKRKKSTVSPNAFILGLLNGFMPCGPLQAMQLYALSTGSVLYGALSMFLFCLGTIPLMLFFGTFANYLNRGLQIKINQISTFLIIVLSLTMLNRGLLTMGIDVTSYFTTNYDSYLKSSIKEGYQIIEFDLSYSGYKDIVVEKGTKVELIIHASKESLTGCNNSISIPGYGITVDLHEGENKIEFFPDKIGTYTYTCWMGMLKNKIVVVDKIKEV